MASKVLVWGGVGALLVGTAAWLGAAFIGSNSVDKYIESLQKSPMVASGQITIGKQEHNKGLFTSNGVVEITLPSISLVDGKPPLTITTLYEIAHLPLPTSRGRATIQMDIRGLGLDELLDQPLRVNGTSNTSLAGTVTTALQSQDINTNFDGSQITIAPFQLDISCSQQACRETRDITYKMVLPSLTVKNSTTLSQMDVKDVSINGLLQDLVLKTGTSTLSVGSVTRTNNEQLNFSLANLRLDSESAEKENRYNAAIKVSLAALDSDEYKAKDLVLNYHINGLLSAPLRQIMGIYDSSNSFIVLSDEQSSTLNHSLYEILRGGFSFGIDNLSGSVSAADGQNAHWIGSSSSSLTAASADASISLQSHLSSNGSIKVTGNAAEPYTQLSPLLKPITDGFEASYALKDGTLTISDQSLPAPLVQGILTEFDAALNRLPANGPSAEDWRQAFSGSTSILPNDMGN